MIIKINGKQINLKKTSPKKEVIIEKPKPRLFNPNILYSISPLTPITLIDTNFILLGIGIVIIAIVEKKFAEYGYISIAEIIYKTFNIILPVAGYGAILCLISKTANLFL